MQAANIGAWIRIGVWALPVYGLLTFWTTLDPQPDPTKHYEAWARYVTTNHYVLTHVLGSGLGTVLAIFGVFALGAYLATGRAGRLGLVAMVMTVMGQALFLMVIGVSAFSAPEEGQAYLAGIEEFAKLPSTFADTVTALTGLLLIVLAFVGNVLLGIAVWRSGTLPRWAGVLWVAAAVLMWPLGIVIAAAITNSTPRTVLVGALLIVISGGWIAWSVLRRPTAEVVGVAAQPRVR
jgi:hypothetical protein